MPVLARKLDCLSLALHAVDHLLVCSPCCPAHLFPQAWTWARAGARTGSPPWSVCWWRRETGGRGAWGWSIPASVLGHDSLQASRLLSRVTQGPAVGKGHARATLLPWQRNCHVAEVYRYLQYLHRQELGFCENFKQEVVPPALCRLIHIACPRARPGGGLELASIQKPLTKLTPLLWCLRFIVCPFRLRARVHDLEEELGRLRAELAATKSAAAAAKADNIALVERLRYGTVPYVHAAEPLYCRRAVSCVPRPRSCWSRLPGCCRRF